MKMAYDQKRLRMFKWLEHIATQHAQYMGKIYPTRFTNILTIYGSMYATNGIILAQVDYPEFEHVSDYGWMKVVSFTDENGFLTETPELAEFGQDMREKYFSDLFIKVCEDFENGFAFNPKVFKDALKPFEIYRLNPVMYVSGGKCELSAHNKDVSIRVLLMGVIQ